jgi:hypothetical protein
MQGVAESDVYLLLLGPIYGDPLPETGRSPSHEEYIAALSRGIPRLAFVKADVDPEDAEQAFIREVEDYGTGLFRASFTDTADLQTQVVSALRDIDKLQPTTWNSLDSPVEVDWRENWTHPRQQHTQGMGSEIDVHALPIPPVDLSARLLRDAASTFTQRLRALNIVPSSEAIQSDSDASAAWACPEAGSSKITRWDELRSESLLGVRVSAAGQRSAWQSLPADPHGEHSRPPRSDLPDWFAPSTPWWPSSTRGR